MKNLKQVFTAVILLCFLAVNSVAIAQGKPEKAKKQEKKEKVEHQKAKVKTD